MESLSRLAVVQAFTPAHMPFHPRVVICPIPGRIPIKRPRNKEKATAWQGSWNCSWDR
jgi:hypothetical protein